jgi:hypothetical protein
MDKALVFLSHVQRAVDERGRPFDEYMSRAVKAAREIPKDVTAEDAAVEFIRVLYDDPFGDNAPREPRL